MNNLKVILTDQGDDASTFVVYVKDRFSVKAQVGYVEAGGINNVRAETDKWYAMDADGRYITRNPVPLRDALKQIFATVTNQAIHDQCGG